MAGLLDILDKISRNPALGQGLLQMGANMLQASSPSFNPASGSFGNALGAGFNGMNQGMNNYQKQQLGIADQQYKQMQMMSQARKYADEQRQRDLLSNIDFNQPKDQLAQQLAGAGLVKEAIDLGKQKREGTPVGFDITDNPNVIKPKMIQLPNGETLPYSDYLLDKAFAAKQMPGYGAEQDLLIKQNKFLMDQQKFAMDQQKFQQEQDKYSKELEHPKLSESQAKAAVYMGQMNSATDTLKNLEQSGFNPVSTASQADIAMAGGLSNFLSSPEAQQYRQAQEQWAEAFLRYKTGAATNKDEIIRNIRIYFPQLGDDDKVIAQKELMRKSTEIDMAKAAGPAGINALSDQNNTNPEQPKRRSTDKKPSVDASTDDIVNFLLGK